MKIVEFDDDIYQAIDERIKDFWRSPNAHLRVILGLSSQSSQGVTASSASAHSIEEFLASRDYNAATTADEQYLKLIGWLLRNHTDLRSRLDGFRARRRVLFSHDEDKITKSAQSIRVKPVPGIDFPFFAMMTLSNPDKRKYLRRVLRLANYAETIIEKVVMTLRDSGITRGARRDLLEKLAGYE